METATFAGGCFWCGEAVFQRLKGVLKVTSGYTGGETDNPSYEEVVSGQTGHAEAIQIEFNPKEITFEKLLQVFFATHDPTTLNQQGADVGTQYRSAVFYKDEEQRKEAESFIKQLEASKKYDKPIVTKVEPLKKFYSAGTYHKDFYDNHKDAPYCQIVIDPKIQKLYRDFKDNLK
jgi:peptide-methionine (S)-S-oxide reductase